MQPVVKNQLKSCFLDCLHSDVVTNSDDNPMVYHNVSVRWRGHCLDKAIVLLLYIACRIQDCIVIVHICTMA